MPLTCLSITRGVILAALLSGTSARLMAQDITPTLVPSPALNSQPQPTPKPTPIPSAAPIPAPGAPGPASAATTIAKPLNVADFDADKDGTVSTDEFLAYHAERLMKFFDTLDADKDGSLNQAELAKIQRRTTTFQGPRPGEAGHAAPAPPVAKPPVKPVAPSAPAAP